MKLKSTLSPFPGEKIPEIKFFEKSNEKIENDTMTTK